VNVLSDALIVDCSSDDRQSYLEFLSIAGMPEGVLNEKLKTKADVLKTLS